MRHPNDEISVAACRSFELFCHAYFEGEQAEGVSTEPLVKSVREMFTPSRTDQSGATTKGYNAAFGMLSASILKQLCPELIEVVMSNCVARGRPSDNVEARKEAELPEVMLCCCEIHRLHRERAAPFPPP